MSTSFVEDEKMNPTLESLMELNTLKWIFVGGKGGVGKTTTSSSIAVELARRRESVLILSTDPAHNLSDAFSQKFNSKPTLVKGFSNLYAMEIDSSIQENMQYKVPDNSGSMGFTKLIPELVSAFPGIDEALSFAELMNSVRTMNYSVIVFDTAPTGHTLRLIGFPDLLEKGLTKLVALRDKMSGALNMMSSMAGNLINEEEIHQKLDSLKALTASVKSHFQDPSLTTFVCVCIPEFLSVYETERLVQELMKHHIDTSHIVVNQVLFPIVEADAIEIDSQLLNEPTKTKHEEQLKLALNQALEKINHLEMSVIARRKMQSKYLKQIDDLYSQEFHVVAMPLQPKEVRGVESIRKFSELLCSPRTLPIISQNH